MKSCAFNHLAMAGLLIVGVASVNTSEATTFHVSPAARGGGNGSPAAPFGDPASAVDAASPGDTIVLSQGTYRLKRALTVDKAHLKLLAVSGERVVLAAPDSVNTVLEIVASGVLIQDLTIQGGYYGIKIDLENGRPTRGVTIRNCKIGSTAADCMKIFSADNLLIDSCQIGPSGSKQSDNAEGIDIVASVGVTIRGCVVENTATNGIYIKGGTRNGIIERCLIRNPGHGGILLGQDTDLEYMRDKAVNEAINCVARNNIVIGARVAGLGTYSGKQVRFYNNTLVDVARDGQAAFWVVTNQRNVPAEQVEFRNNIVVVNSDRPVMFIKDAAGLPDTDHNLFQAKGGVKFVREVTDNESFNKTWTLDQWRNSVAKDAHSVEAEAKLDPRQYRPVAGSPAIGAGARIAGIDDDYTGARRMPAGAWDMGAILPAIAK